MVYLDTGLEHFLKKSLSAANLIIEKFNTNMPFRFKVLASYPGEEPILIDNPGILDGVTGIVLSLLLTTSKKRELWTDLLFV